MKEAKKTKFVSGLRNLGIKLRWFLFTELQDYKLTSGYINFICPDSKNKQVNHIEELRSMIRHSLIREFSPKIQSMKSFDLLVDTVMYQIQRKSVEKDTEV